MQPALFCGPGPFPGSRALEGPKVGRKPGAGFIVILGLSSTPSYKAKKTMADRCPYPFPPAGAKPSGHVSVFVSPPNSSLQRPSGNKDQPFLQTPSPTLFPPTHSPLPGAILHVEKSIKFVKVKISDWDQKTDRKSIFFKIIF